MSIFLSLCLIYNRVQAVDPDTESVTVNVERIGGRQLDIAVSWTTDELGRPTEIAGITMHPARPGADFRPRSGILQFPQGQVSGIYNKMMLLLPHRVNYAVRSHPEHFLLPYNERQ